MNLRDIKKDIEYVISAFVDDCYTFATVNPAASDEALSAMLDEAIELFNDLKDRANEKPQGGKKAHFAAIRKELIEKTDALYEKLSALIKESCKVD